MQTINYQSNYQSFLSLSLVTIPDILSLLPVNIHTVMEWIQHYNNDGEACTICFGIYRYLLLDKYRHQSENRIF